jgi:hypothetical protein
MVRLAKSFDVIMKRPVPNFPVLSFIRIREAVNKTFIGW